MLDEIIRTALLEDIGEGDHSTLACVPQDAQGSAKLLVKDTGIIAGVELAERIFHLYDPNLQFIRFIEDGRPVKPGEIVFEIVGHSASILSTERLVLNFMQRMSGIATQTYELTRLISGTKARL